MQKKFVIILAALVLATALAMVAMAAPQGASNSRHNLSETSDKASLRPDMASDGDRTGVVWIEKLEEHSGGHVYLRGSSAEGVDNKIRVYTGDSGSCAYDVSVDVQGDTAHVAYVEFSDTCDNPDQTRLWYKTCSLADGGCNPARTKVASSGTDSESITWVDIALDTEGGPHLVWAEYNQDGVDGAIRYATSPWGEDKAVAIQYDNREPAIAWAGGFLHVVWSEGVEHDIHYRRYDTENGDWKGDQIIFDGQEDAPPGSPDVAAGSGQVFVVWDQCAQGTGDTDECDLYYRSSEDFGSSWNASEVVQTYNSNPSDSPSHFSDLQPSVVIKDGWPAVVWHALSDADYAVYYGVRGNVEWTSPIVLSEGSSPGVGSTAIGVRQESREEWLDIAYVRPTNSAAWDVYYESFSYAPQARIRAATMVESGSGVDLDGSDSSSPLGAPLSYDWQLIDKPDNSSAEVSDWNDPVLTLRLDVAGCYTVGLEVDNGSGTDQATHKIEAFDTLYQAYLPLTVRQASQ